MDLQILIREAQYFPIYEFWTNISIQNSLISNVDDSFSKFIKQSLIQFQLLELILTVQAFTKS